MQHKVVICGVDTSLLPKLTALETNVLLKKCADGDKNARSLLISANMRLVLSVLRRYNVRTASPDDLFQVGAVGLIKAIDNFDLRFNVRFSTYAVPMIAGEIRRYLRELNSMRVSRGLRDVAYLVMQAKETLELQGVEVTLDDVAEHLKMPIFKVVDSMNAISDTLSLSDPVFSDEDDTFTLADQLFDKKQSETTWVDNVSLKSAFAELCDREKLILYKRYFQGKTQTEISAEIGLSQAQISRLEKTAIESLRSQMSD